MKYKAYSFDLDNNLLTLPTKISLGTDQGEIKKVSTKDYEKIKADLENSPYEIIPSSFNEFRLDSQFLKDITKSEKAGSWQNLVNCLAHHASIFAIITARGHSPRAIKEGLRWAILKNLTKAQLKEFSEKFQAKYKIRASSPEEALDKHLDLCKFYPLDNPRIRNRLGSNETAELKYLAFKDFQDYISRYVKDKFGKETEITIGFSDDSIINLRRMMKEILNSRGLFLYQTTSKGKNHLNLS